MKTKVRVLRLRNDDFVSRLETKPPSIQIPSQSSSSFEEKGEEGEGIDDLRATEPQKNNLFNPNAKIPHLYFLINIS